MDANETDDGPETAPRTDTRKPGFNGRPVTVFEDGSDDYTGEDDLTGRAIENENDAWASGQTALDEGYGRRG
jgi:hypothetical protein